MVIGSMRRYQHERRTREKALVLAGLLVRWRSGYSGSMSRFAARSPTEQVWRLLGCSLQIAAGGILPSLGRMAHPNFGDCYRLHCPFIVLSIVLFPSCHPVDVLF